MRAKNGEQLKRERYNNKGRKRKARVRFQHIRDMKDTMEVQLPCRNRVFVIPRMEESKDPVGSAPLHDLFLYICDDPTIDAMVSGRRGDTCR